jgi:hypothetical protein
MFDSSASPVLQQQQHPQVGKHSLWVAPKLIDGTKIDG